MRAACYARRRASRQLIRKAVLDELNPLCRQFGLLEDDAGNIAGGPRQEFVELRLGGPDNLVFQHLYQPVDRGIADCGLEHPVGVAYFLTDCA